MWNFLISPYLSFEKFWRLFCRRHEFSLFIQSFWLFEHFSWYFSATYIIFSSFNIKCNNMKKKWRVNLNVIWIFWTEKKEKIMAIHKRVNGINASNLCVCFAMQWEKNAQNDNIFITFLFVINKINSRTPMEARSKPQRFQSTANRLSAKRSVCVCVCFSVIAAVSVVEHYVFLSDECCFSLSLSLNFAHLWTSEFTLWFLLTIQL